MMNKEILWLPSWYPNRFDPFDGDFIQRHAFAAAKFRPVYVLYVVPDVKGLVTMDVHEEIRKEGGLTEHIIYFKKSAGIAGKVFGMRKWTQLYKRAIINYINNYGVPSLVHVHVAMRAGMVALWARKKFGIAFLVSEHWTIYQPGATGAYSRRNFLFRHFTRKIIRNCSALLTVSEDLGKQIQKFVSPRDFIVVPNVVNTGLFYFKPAGQSEFDFLHVSNMNYQKNAELIIESFVAVHKEFPKTRLQLVGRAGNHFYELVKQTGLLNQAIFFVGEVPYAGVAKIMKESNALVMCSRFENQPCVILESLCSGLPVISTTVGGIPEVVNKGNGILIADSSKDILAAAMKKMIRERSSFNGQAIAADAGSRYNYDVVGQQLANVYQRFGENAAKI